MIEWLDFLLAKAGAIVVAGVATWIGVWAYPKQKDEDRKLQVLAEKREVYRNFFAAAANYFDDLVRAGQYAKTTNSVFFPPESSRDVAQHLDAIVVYAPKDVVEQCFRYTNCLNAYETLLKVEIGEQNYTRRHADIETSQEAYGYVQVARKLAMVLARKDAQNCSLETAKADLVGVMNLGDHGMAEHKNIQEAEA